MIIHHHDLHFVICDKCQTGSAPVLKTGTGMQMTYTTSEPFNLHGFGNRHLCEACDKKKVDVNKREPHVEVEGAVLTQGQAMAVRVAVSSFLSELAEPEHMKEMGEIGPLYQARLREVESLMVG